MPLYTYQCKECGVRFERQQSFHDAPLTTCPECEGEIYRVIGATGVIFKGSGFYVTDNRKSSSGSNRSGSKSAAAESSGDSKSGESKSSTTESSASSASSSTSSSE